MSSPLHHKSFIVTSINGQLHVTWTEDDDSTTVSETIDANQSFANESDCHAWLNEYARAYNAGVDRAYSDAHPTIDPSIAAMVGQTFSVT